jgi:excinuclease ABC subunit A
MRSGPKHCLYVFDEPTTGLHFEDVKVLLELFQELVDEGHSVLMVEHHVDVIRSADWIIDLGPEGGEGGGRLVVCGPPGLVQEHAGSHTGAALRESALPG